MRHALLLFLLCFIVPPVHAETLLVTSGRLQTFGDQIGLTVSGDNFSFSSPGERGNTPISLGVVGLPGESVEIRGNVGTLVRGHLFGVSYPSTASFCSVGLPIQCPSMSARLMGMLTLPTIEAPLLHVITPVNVSLQLLIDSSLPNPGLDTLLAEGLADVTLFGGNAACVISFCYQVGNLTVDLHAPVPEPSMFILLGTGLVGLALWQSRRLRSQL